MSQATPPLTFEQRQRQESLWVVCEDAFIPVATETIGRAVIESIYDCKHRHELVRLNLRPINYNDVWAHWKRFAWEQGANKIPATTTVVGTVGRWANPEWLYDPLSDIRDQLERALDKSAPVAVR